MQFCKFIECRVGEPITALDVHKNFVLLGSISGYYAIYDMDSNLTVFSEKCEKHVIRDCCLHIGATRKFKNPVSTLEESPSEKYFQKKNADDSSEEQEENMFDSKENFGKSSLIFKEASEMKFEYEKKNVDLAYLAIGDNGVLRIDIKRFFRERLIQKSKEGKTVTSEEVYEKPVDFETFYKLKYYSYKFHPLMSPHMMSLLRRRKNGEEFNVENFSNYSKPDK